MEALAKLPPVFKEGGTVTAGNSSGRNDAAAVTLVMSREKAEELGLKPKMRIISQAVAGVRPTSWGLGPCHPKSAEAGRFDPGRYRFD